MTGPGFWMDEQSGVLRPAVEAYLLLEDELSPEHIGVMRAYLRQWIMAPVWCGPAVTALREALDGIESRAGVDRWLGAALKVGIDPL